MGEKRGKMTKNFLNPQIFSQTASERLDLFSCLPGGWVGCGAYVAGGWVGCGAYVSVGQM